MKTNEIKKGMTVKLRNGWSAVITDNLKGNIRSALVSGIFTEHGSVYAHDIVACDPGDGYWQDIEYTAQQRQLRRAVSNIF